MRCFEGRLDHLVELEVWLDLGLVEIVARLPQFLGVVAPIPGREREITALLRNHALERIAFGRCLQARTAPNFIEQLARCCRRLGHLIVEPVIGEVRKAEQLRALVAQRHHFSDQCAVVGRSAVLTAADPGLECPFAQVAPGRN